MEVVCKNVGKRMFPDYGMALAGPESMAILDWQRLIDVVEDLQLNTDTCCYPVEAHMLLREFEEQLCHAGVAGFGLGQSGLRAA